MSNVPLEYFCAEFLWLISNNQFVKCTLRWMTSRTPILIIVNHKLHYSVSLPLSNKENWHYYCIVLNCGLISTYNWIKFISGTLIYKISKNVWLLAGFVFMLTGAITHAWTFVFVSTHIAWVRIHLKAPWSGWSFPGYLKGRLTP